jgi:hypothetical protein
MGLTAKFVDEVAIVVEHGAIGDHNGRAKRCFQLGCDLLVQNPKLAGKSSFRIHGKGRLARDFGDKLDVMVRFLQ